MSLVSIIAELQTNPRSISAYRRLITEFRNCNKNNEAEAFEALIEKLNADTHSDEE